MENHTEELIKLETNALLEQLETHAKMCAQDIIEDIFVIGMNINKLGKNDMNRVYSATGKFYKECVCTKKISK